MGRESPHQRNSLDQFLFLRATPAGQWRGLFPFITAQSTFRLGQSRIFFCLHQDFKSRQVFGFRSRGARRRGDFRLGDSAFVSIRSADCCAVDDDAGARLTRISPAIGVTEIAL